MAQKTTQSDVISLLEIWPQNRKIYSGLRQSGKYYIMHVLLCETAHMHKNVSIYMYLYILYLFILHILCTFMSMVL